MWNDELHNLLTIYHHVGVLGITQTVPLQVLQHLHRGRQAVATTAREWPTSQGERGTVRERAVQGGRKAGERERGGKRDYGKRWQGVYAAQYWYSSLTDI